jgi:hypothetical protein
VWVKWEGFCGIMNEMHKETLQLSCDKTPTFSLLDEGPWIQLDEVDFDQIEERLDAAIQDFSADVFIPIQIDDYD